MSGVCFAVIRRGWKATLDEHKFILAGRKIIPSKRLDKYTCKVEAKVISPPCEIRQVPDFPMEINDMTSVDSVFVSKLTKTEFLLSLMKVFY